MTTKEYNETYLDDFPGYKCYYISAVNGDYSLTKVSGNTEPIVFRYTNKYYRPSYVFTNHQVIDNRLIPSILCGDDDITDSDAFIVHPNCIIPRTLISKGKVLNDKSPEVPTKIVIPYGYLNSVGTGQHCILAVNDFDKLIFLITVYYATSNDYRDCEATWLDAIRNSPELVGDFGYDKLSRVSFPYGRNRFRVTNVEPLDYALLTGSIPPENVVCENRLHTGTEKLSADMLYSCFKMLYSVDTQITETACNMLARSDFSNVESVVYWLLYTYRSKISYYKSKSTAFKWLWFMCFKQFHRSTPVGLEIAKQLLVRLTDNKVKFDDCRVVITDSDCLEFNHIRRLVSLINKGC